MPAYLISEIEILDPEGYEEYRRLVKPTLDKYGGKFLARGGRIEVLEGRWNPRRIVICEFENLARARQWYDSPEYEKARQIRQRNARANIIVVEGV
ncbi:MAG TPA: DUF1330 domain-containing protein [Burkholderiales bacterium]|jgi:uncharacterized protein (DUF1330 family)|nr:DUF1330 domain-containing protein [Burkholderiales bacterium]